jgi:hypothetical protein
LFGFLKFQPERLFLLKVIYIYIFLINYYIYGFLEVSPLQRVRPCKIGGFAPVFAVVLPVILYGNRIRVLVWGKGFKLSLTNPKAFN